MATEEKENEEEEREKVEEKEKEEKEKVHEKRKLTLRESMRLFIDLIDSCCRDIHCRTNEYGGDAEHDQTIEQLVSATPFYNRSHMCTIFSTIELY